MKILFMLFGIFFIVGEASGQEINIIGQCWGVIDQPKPVSAETLTSLKKKVYEFHPREKIGDGVWSKRQKTPGEIVDIEIEKVSDNPKNSMTVYYARKLKPDIFKVVAGFSGQSGSIAVGTLKVTVYYE